MTYQLHHGNCLDILPMMDRESVDSIVTDPPYGLSFMGKDWDHGVPGMHFWLEALRCAKPGAHLLAFGGTRTFHRLAVAIEDAGWEIRDCVMWVYGQGFPKSHDVSKAIDKEAGETREREPDYRSRGVNRATYAQDRWTKENYGTRLKDGALTESAQEWNGWGTALKPAWEPIIVARKPLQGTVAENVQRYGTGGLNIDQCRIGNDEITSQGSASLHLQKKLKENGARPYINGFPGEGFQPTTHMGRWPANLIHDGSAEVLAGFPMTTSGAGDKTHRVISAFSQSNYAERLPSIGGDTGSAARFFYCAKASKQDRDEGCEDIPLKRTAKLGGSDNDRDDLDPVSERFRTSPSSNNHPTVKPTSLMRYLCRLVTPPNGVILDPFMGSGSTGKAAILEGFNFIGVDTEIEYVEIAARRIEYACEKVGIVIDQPMLFDTKREIVDKPKQLILL